jgi:hypothetical protein
VIESGQRQNSVFYIFFSILLVPASIQLHLLYTIYSITCLSTEQLGKKLAIIHCSDIGTVSLSVANISGFPAEWDGVIIVAFVWKVDFFPLNNFHILFLPPLFFRKKRLCRSGSGTRTAR